MSLIQKTKQINTDNWADIKLKLEGKLPENWGRTFSVTSGKNGELQVKTLTAFGRFLGFLAKAIHLEDKYADFALGKDRMQITSLQALESKVNELFKKVMTDPQVQGTHALLHQLDHNTKKLVMDQLSLSDLAKVAQVNKNSELLVKDTGRLNEQKKMMVTVANLPVVHSDVIFTYQTEEEIKKLGGISLARKNNISTYPEDAFIGIAALKLEDNSFLLVLCPGGGNMEFKEENFKDLMPKAIQKLIDLKIVPKGVSDNIGRHPGDTLIKFQQWQESTKGLIQS